MKEFGKMVGLAVWAIVTIAASAGAMNSGEGFYIFCGAANLLLNGYNIYRVGKKVSENAD